MWCVHKFLNIQTSCWYEQLYKPAPGKYDVIRKLHLHETSSTGVYRQRKVLTVQYCNCFGEGGFTFEYRMNIADG